MSQELCHKVAAFFARGGQLIDARVIESSQLPASGSLVTLHARDLHTRSTERCTRPCCATEPTAAFKVETVQAFSGGFEGLSEVVESRQWDEASCRHHEWCSLFDSYSLLGYLGIAPDEGEMPGTIVVVEVAEAA